MEKNNNPKTKLSTPHPHPIPTSEFIMLVNVFQETFFGNESFFSQERITSDLLWSVTATAWCIGGFIQRGMWYISIQYAHAHTHTHTHTHNTHTNCMVHWWFYLERYVVHQQKHACVRTLTHASTAVWCSGGSIQRGMWYISMQCTRTHTHTHTNVCIHSQTHCHQLLLINGLLRWVVTARGMLCILAYCIIMPWAVHMQIICARIHTHTSCTHRLSLWFVYITCWDGWNKL